MNQTIYIEVGTKKYPLIISPCSDPEDIAEGAVHIKCEEAELDQEYLEEDLHLLLKDLPEMIQHFQAKRKKGSVTIRMNPEDIIKIEQLAQENGYKNISSYIRAKTLQVK